jgi:hypothetical protein
MKGNPIFRRDPCGCIIRSNDVEFCPQHKPAWRVGAEVLIDRITGEQGKEDDLSRMPNPNDEGR